MRRVDVEANRFRSSVWLAVVSGVGTLRLLPVGVPGEPVCLRERPDVHVPVVRRPLWTRVQRARIILDFFGRHLGGDRPS